MIYRRPTEDAGRGRDPLDVLKSEADGRVQTPHSERRAGKTHYQQKYYPEKLTSESKRATAVATRWISAGEEYGFPSPFNDIWLGNQIHAKVIKDPVMVPLLMANEQSKVTRLLTKMVDLFWSDYVDDSISPKNACSVFLDDVWDDLRDYALSCLRAAHLKAHGIRHEPVEYAPREAQEMHQALDEVKVSHFIERSRTNLEPPSGPVLDSHRREVLRSLSQKRGGKK